MEAGYQACQPTIHPERQVSCLGGLVALDGAGRVPQVTGRELCAPGKGVPASMLNR